MNKDVIYIDVDDDVTAIIGKIKNTNEKIVALVPPKRSGVLQSAVNLRLLARMAHSEGKRLVLITNNHALAGLAANAKIPTAKNLQSKPELAEIPALAVDNDDDIIDGSQLPVGELAKTVKTKGGDSASRPLRSDAITSTDLNLDDAQPEPEITTPTARVASKKKKGTKIPNFDTFRKKLIFIITGGVALIALLVWMFVFAPAATVVITASTTPQSVSATVKLGGSAATDFESGVVASLSQQQVTNETVDFDATGQKDVGEKASGSVIITNCDTNDSFVVESGTAVSYGSLSYILQSDATVSGAKFSGGSCSAAGQSSAVRVVAQNSGDSYNISDVTLGVAGYGSTVKARISGNGISGGTTRIAKVVSEEDVERARGVLIGKSTDSQKKALTEKFSSDDIVIDSSFVVQRGDASSSPAVGQEASSGKATLTIPTTYSMQAVAKSELETYLKDSLTSKIDTSDQKIYSTGIGSATLSNFVQEGNTMSATVNAKGAVGPTIDENEIKEFAKGKKYGDIQQSLEAREGIKDVDVKFSYFWVRTVPNNTDKIKVEFKIENE